MRAEKLNGIFIPHITPFKQNGELDEEALRICIQFWLKSKVAGLVPCGSNGEAPYLTRDERRRIIKIVLDEVDGKAVVIAGTGSPSTKETILFTKDAKELGVDAALVVTPFYYKLSSKEILKHYETLLTAVDLPIILYSVPKFTGITLEPTLISQLASEHDNVIGVKDSSGSIGAITETITLVGDKISVLAGTADAALATLMLGGSGAVIAVANVFPEICNNLYKAFVNKRLQKASKLQRQIAYINEVLVKKYNQLSAIKEAMTLRGLPGGYPRMPALSLEEKERSDIENLLAKIPS